MQYSSDPRHTHCRDPGKQQAGWLVLAGSYMDTLYQEGTRGHAGDLPPPEIWNEQGLVGSSPDLYPRTASLKPN